MSRVGYAVRPKKPSRVISAEPYSPCLAITTRGPRSSAACAARIRFGSSVSCLSSASLRTRQSTSRDRRQQRLVRDVDPQVHRVHRDEARGRALLAHLALQLGLDVGEEDDLGRARGVRELRLEVLEHVEVGLERVALVDVAVVAPGPEEGLARRGTCSTSSVITPRAWRIAYSASPKSSPTGPTMRVSASCDEAIEKCTAAPPSRRSRLPAGVSTASKAMDPTTVSVMAAREASAGRHYGPAHARDPDHRVGRARGARAGRRPAGARARRPPGARARHELRDQLRRHPRARELLPRALRAAVRAGRGGRGRGRARRRGASRPASASWRSSAPAATPSTSPRRPRRRSRSPRA